MIENGTPFDVASEEPPYRIYTLEAFTLAPPQPGQQPRWSYRLKGHPDVIAEPMPGTPPGDRPQQFNLHLTNQRPAVVRKVRLIGG